MSGMEAQARLVELFDQFFDVCNSKVREVAIRFLEQYVCFDTRIASLDCLTPTHGQIIRTGIQVNIFYLKNLKGPINKTSLVDLAQTKLWLLVVLEC